MPEQRLQRTREAYQGSWDALFQVIEHVNPADLHALLVSAPPGSLPIETAQRVLARQTQVGWTAIPSEDIIGVELEDQGVTYVVKLLNRSPHAGPI